jgi:hypothetical protein
LQRGLKGGDWREPVLFLESLLEMRQGELGGVVRGDPWRRAQTGERRADGGLSLRKSFPDPIRGGVAQAAIQFSLTENIFLSTMFPKMTLSASFAIL